MRKQPEVIGISARELGCRCYGRMHPECGGPDLRALLRELLAAYVEDASRNVRERPDLLKRVRAAVAAYSGFGIKSATT